jgi:hypothetical protein
MIYRTKYNRYVDKDNVEVSESDLKEYLEANGTILETDFNFPDDVEVPQTITRRQFKIALSVLGYKEQDIIDGINQLPEPNKTIAMISYTEAGSFDRFNPELIFVAKTFLNLTDLQLNEIFITGNEY